jgi:hypothetical protein
MQAVARYQLILATAERRAALGADLASLTALDADTTSNSR